MASLFMLVPNSEEGVALFMCAGTILTPNIVATAAHCFTGNAERADLWFVRVGDNFILRPEDDEQTFRVRKIVKHHQFKPLSDPDGDGRNDIAIVVLQVCRSEYHHSQSHSHVTILVVTISVEI